MDAPKVRRWAHAFAVLLALTAAVLAGGSWTSPPAPVPRDAPAGAFSSARALAHVAAIAQRPHRTGSAEHARVVDYVVDQLRALGLSPEIHEALAVQTRYRPARFARVRNVVARLPKGGDPGGGAGKALLLVAHTDTRSMTPGASDDGYGVATLLETARALRAEPGAPFASDIVLLFTDGEEEGLLGAHAFVTQDPWAREVGLVINLEARGNAGPALMFQTGDDNGALIRVLARAAPHAAASSLSAAVYRRMPNDTDLSEWLPRTPSLNFANIGGFERYHAPTDTPGHADERTLQHHGAQALALARAFAAEPLPLPREPNAVYFDVGPFLVRYPGALELPLAIAAAVLLAVFLVVGHRRGVLRARFVALGLLAALGLVPAAASAGLWALALRLHAEYRPLAVASPVLKQLHLASFLALSAALVLAFQAGLRRWIRALEIFAAAAAIFAGLALALAAALPGGAFLFTWPLLAALPPAIALVRTGPPEGGAAPPSSAQVALAIGASVPGLLLVAPFLPQLFTAFGPDAGPVLAGLAALLVASAAPALHLWIAPRPLAAPLAAAALAAGLALAANLRAPFDRDHPRPDTVFFALDRDDGRGYWVTPDPKAPAWAAEAFAGATRGPAPLPFPLGSVLASPAPSVREAGPAIVWTGPAASGAGRSLRLRVFPPAGAELLAVRAADVLSARVEGRVVPLDEGALAFRFYAPPAAGVEIDITAASAASVVVQAVSQRSGLPSSLTPAPGARPPDRMAKPGMMPPWDDLLESDMTIVATSSAR